MSDPAVYPRVVLKGTLTLRSDLILRSGKTASRRGLDLGEDDAVPQVSLVAEGVDGPYIPGSSLKGALRAWADANPAVASETIFQVFGRKPEPEDPSERNSPQQSLGGKLEVWDAFALTDNRLVRGSTRIERATGTAEHTALRFGEQVAAGTVFDVWITGDHLTDEEIASVLEALSACGSAIQLGGGRNAGFGLAEWQCSSLRVMDQAAVGRWLADDRALHWMQWLTDHVPVTRDPDRSCIAQAAAAPMIEVTLRLDFDGPFLVSEPVPPGERNLACVAAPWPERPGDLKRAPGQPNRQPVRRHGSPEAGRAGDEPFLPGTSVRGVLRSQAERIWRTVKGRGRDLDNEGKTAGGGEARSIGRIFGSTGEAGLLSVGDFLAVEPLARVEEQDFIAVDRFTGGAKDGAKFRIEMVEKPSFEGTLRLRLRSPEYRLESGKPNSGAPPRVIGQGDLGLLALLLRDLIEGDLTFGFGRTKGYGACRAQIRSLRWAGLAEAPASQGGWQQGDAIDRPWRDWLEAAVKVFREEGYK